ncbi:hypothetical protein C4D60_Mb08t09080 [Musa balbisiana]|uniref:DUF7803 domain-containing protein n=1 Tax=Musa balbisiana TaxID=52838 RepID=A0A4V4H8T3_MUSBA|nr:hypothetical protein C4D60_Mb08t09080 [Musa balbisiana]
MITVRCYDPTAWIEAVAGARDLFDDGRDDGLAPKPSFSSRLLAVGAPVEHHPVSSLAKEGHIPVEQPRIPTMEETILLGDDLMLGLPSPIIPPEIASHVLEGVDLCDGVLRNLFLLKESHLVNALGFQIDNIEPFCQDEIVLYQQCAEKRQRKELLNSNRRLHIWKGTRFLQVELKSWKDFTSIGVCMDKKLEALNWGIVKRKPGNIQGEPKGDARDDLWSVRMPQHDLGAISRNAFQLDIIFSYYLLDKLH